MIDIENCINDSVNGLFYEALPPEFDPIQTLLRIPTDPFSISRKWFEYDDGEDEERYDEDW